MRTFIWLFVILFVVSKTFRSFIWRLLSSGIDKIAGAASAAKPVQDIPDDPGLSDAEITQKLRVLKTVRKFNKITGPVIVISIFGLFIMHIGETMSFDEFFLKYLLPVGTVFVLMAVVAVITSKRIKELKGIMGISITLPILREAFEVKGYSPNNFLGWKVIEESELMSYGDMQSGSDFTEGSYRGINFLFSDLHLKHREKDDDGDDIYVTHFKGLWLVCDFGGELPGDLLLKEQKGGGSDIETESVAFNEKFKIFTKDPHSAFLLLTPHIMERLMAFDKLADATTFLSFRKNGRVHIALDSWNDSFDVERMKDDNLDGLRERFRRDVRYLTGIMDALLENDKLLKKE